MLIWHLIAPVLMKTRATLNNSVRPRAGPPGRSLRLRLSLLWKSTIHLIRLNSACGTSKYYSSTCVVVKAIELMVEMTIGCGLLLRR